MENKAPCGSQAQSYAQERVLPYNTEEKKSQQVESMFDNIASTYDVLNHALSWGIDKRWRKKSVHVLSAYPHQNILDVATGTGDFAILLAQKLHPQSLCACDFSKGMLALAHAKVMRAHLDGVISFQKEDAECLSFADASFDLVTIAYGARNFEHLDVCLREMFRVLRPGGRLAILELSAPSRFPMKQLFALYARFWMPLVGRSVSGDGAAYRYLPRSIEVCPQGEQMTQILCRAGFSEACFHRFTQGLCTLYIAVK